MLENLEKSVFCFSKWDLSCKSVFWGCEFSGVLVFSETHAFNRSLCFTLQAVAQKQRQMLVKLKKDIFLKLRCIIQLSFVRLRFPIVLVFSEKHGFSNIPCVNVRGVAKQQRKMFEKLKKLVILEMSSSFMQLCFLRLRLSEMLICQGLGALATGTRWLPAQHVKLSPARGAPQRRWRRCSAVLLQ